MHGLMEADGIADQIAVLYAKASAHLDGEMDHIFERHRMKHGLTKAGAMRLLNAMHDKTSLDELLRRLRQGEGSQRELAAQLEGAAYGARLERLMRLQARLDLTMTEIYGQELRLSAAHYINLARESYYRTLYDAQQRVGATFGFSPVTAKTIDQTVHSPWLGKNYSERIWGNTQALAQSVKEGLLVNLVTGRTNREAAEAISNEFAGGPASRGGSYGRRARSFPRSLILKLTRKWGQRGISIWPLWI